MIAIEIITVRYLLGGNVCERFISTEMITRALTGGGGKCERETYTVWGKDITTCYCKHAMTVNSTKAVE